MMSNEKGNVRKCRARLKKKKGAEIEEENKEKSTEEQEKEMYRSGEDKDGGMVSNDKKEIREWRRGKGRESNGERQRREIKRGMKEENGERGKREKKRQMMREGS